GTARLPFRGRSTNPRPESPHLRLGLVAGRAWRSLPLPLQEDLHPGWQDHYNNVPFANVAAIECDKTSFRLLRRPAGTSYTWHSDKDKGSSVVRFQNPIITHPKSVLVVTDFNEEAEQ